MRHYPKILALLAVALLVAVLPPRARAEAPTMREVVLAAMLRLSPPERHRPPSWAPPEAVAAVWPESPEVRAARYDDIAGDIAAVARSRTEARVLVGVSFHESGWAYDVDHGTCYRGPGFTHRCDSGRASTVFQLQEADPAKVALWKADRRAAAKEARRRLVLSHKACAANAEPEQLAMYAGGVCDLLTAKAAARGLWASIEAARRAGL